MQKISFRTEVYKQYFYLLFLFIAPRTYDNAFRDFWRCRVCSIYIFLKMWIYLRMETHGSQTDDTASRRRYRWRRRLNTDWLGLGRWWMKCGSWWETPSSELAVCVCVCAVCAVQQIALRRQASAARLTESEYYTCVTWRECVRVCVFVFGWGNMSYSVSANACVFYIWMGKSRYCRQKQSHVIDAATESRSAATSSHFCIYRTEQSGYQRRWAVLFWNPRIPLNIKSLLYLGNDENSQ